MSGVMEALEKKKQNMGDSGVAKRKEPCGL